MTVTWQPDALPCVALSELPEGFGLLTGGSGSVSPGGGGSPWLVVVVCRGEWWSMTGVGDGTASSVEAACGGVGTVVGAVLVIIAGAASSSAVAVVVVTSGRVGALCAGGGRARAGTLAAGGGAAWTISGSCCLEWRGRSS